MAIILYVLIFFLVLYVELARKKNTVFDFQTFFHFFFLNSFSIIPIVILLYDGDAPISESYFSGIEHVGNLVTPLLILEGYVLFLLGFFWGEKSRVRELKLVVSISEKKIICLLVIGVLIFYASFYLYTKQFGGIVETIIQTELIRDGVIEGGAFEFVKHFMKVCVICLLVTYFKVFHDPDNKYRRSFKVLFNLSLVNFLLYFLLMNSRGLVVVTFLSMYAITCIVNNRYYFFRMACGGAFVFLVILFGNVFFTSVATLFTEGVEPFFREFEQRQVHETSNFVASVLKNFVHPILSLELSINGDTEFRYFVDFPMAILTLIPERLTGLHLPDSVSVMNTFLHHGVYKSTIPPGIFALFYFSYGAAGVFAGMFFYGFLGGSAQKLLTNSIAVDKSGIVVFFFLLAYAYGAFVDSGEPSAYAISNFILMTTIAILLVFFSKLSRLPNCRMA